VNRSNVGLSDLLKVGAQTPPPRAGDSFFLKPYDRQRGSETAFDAGGYRDLHGNTRYAAAAPMNQYSHELINLNANPRLESLPELRSKT
jgi:hypothetical protein